MLANFFGKSKPVNFIVLFGLFLSYFILVTISKGFSFETFKELFWFLVIFSVFNFIITKNSLTFDNSYAFLFYVLLIGFFSEVIQLNRLFFANVTVLLFLRKVYSLQSSKNTIHKLFDGGLWLGVSFLIEPLTAVFILLFYIAVFLHQQLTIQTIGSPILGFIGPIILYFTYCFWYDKTEEFTSVFLKYGDYSFDVYFTTNYLFAFLFIAFCVILALAAKTPKTLAVKNKFRRNWMLILVHLFLSLLVVAFINDKQISELQFLFFPAAVVLANGLELIKRKLIVDIIIAAFLILSFVWFTL